MSSIGDREYGFRLSADSSWIIPEDKLRTVLSVIDAEPTEDNLEHMAVLMRAMMTFDIRNAGRDSVWKRGGARSAAYMVFAKAERLWQRYMKKNPAYDDDDAVDVINYAVFLIRQSADAQDGCSYSLNGEWPWDEVNS